MTRAASGKPLRLEALKYEPPTETHVNLTKHPHMDGNHKVGDTVHFLAKGKVSSISKNQDGSTMSMDLQKVKKVSSAFLKKKAPMDHGDAEEAGEGAADDEGAE